MVETKNFTVYKSSAGSGKTFTLVKEYLMIALGSNQADRYRGILAITFTNKAANEMKERVISSLEKLTNNEPLDMLVPLIEELKIPEHELRYRAAKVLEHMLHHYADLSISTIDKFVYKIVRTFAHDLKIPLNFEVEMDSEQLIAGAVDQLLSEVGNNKELTRTLVAFTEGKTDDEKSWHIENDITAFAKNLLKEKGQLYAEKLKKMSLDDFMKIRKQLDKKIQEQKKEIQDIAQKALDLISKNGIDPKSFYNGGILPNHFKAVAAFDEKKVDSPAATVFKVFNENKWTSAKCTDAEESAIENIKSELTELFYKMQELAEKNFPNIIVNESILRNIYGLALLNEIEKQIHLIKQEQNIIHISEFNKQIAQIVLKEPAPFIYERLGERYKNYLIDEFQDTSELQFQNVLPLLDNSLATGNFNMLVGDGKQSIYRWRGGEVEQFSNLPKVNTKFGDEIIVNERAETLSRNYHEAILGINYRSHKNIVEFNNWFFKNLKDKLHEDFQDIYKKHEQAYRDDKTDGYVSLTILEYPDKETYYAKTLQNILNTVKQSINDGYSLKDICVLTRKRKDANEAAHFLVNEGYPVISSDSLLIQSNTEVQLVLSVFSYLLNPNDNAAKVSILNHIDSNLDYDFEYEILHDQLKLKEFIEKNCEGFNSEKLTHRSIFEATEEIIRIFGLNKNNNPFLAGLLDFIHDCDGRGITSISEFLTYWDGKKESLSIQIPEGEEAISIMTIHKSKGLQFPVVIFPFANWKTRTDDQIWIDAMETESKLPSALVNTNSALEKTPFAAEYHEEDNKTLLDNINMLYVAFTRPEDRLYVLTSEYSYHDLSKNFTGFVKTSENWNEEQQTFILGKEISLIGKSESSNDNLELDQNVFPHWKPRVEISLQAEKFWEANEQTSQKDYGKLLHYTLSLIIEKDDKQTVLEQLLVNGEINSNDREQIEKDVDEILYSEQLKHLFEGEWNVKTEAEIISKDGQVLRPDRVQFLNNKAVIIDYKTGLTDKKHEKQIDEYSFALKDLGVSEITKLLVYTNPFKVLEV